MTTNNTRKKKIGRPKAEDPAQPYNLTLPSKSVKQLDSLIGCFGKTRSSTIRWIVDAFLEEMGEDGLAQLRKARQYKHEIEKSRMRNSLKGAYGRLASEHVQKMSGGYVGDNPQDDYRLKEINRIRAKQNKQNGRG